MNVLSVLSLRFMPRYLLDMWNYTQHPRWTAEFPLEWRCLYPILGENVASAGVTRSHYFIQDLFMARRVVAEKPAKLVDVGSRLDGFVAQVLAGGVPVEVVDIRPLKEYPEGMSFVQDDATKLEHFADNSVTHLSSLHVAEHFGLGRYGDPIDPQSWRDFLRNMARVLKPGGKLYFSVPMGRQRVEFNAHRVFSPQLLLREFASHGLKVLEQGVITTDGDLRAPANPIDYASEEYGCILLILTKPATGAVKTKKPAGKRARK